MNFDEQYYRSLNYTNYLDREDRYVKMADELISFLEKREFINKKTKMIDYGCAVGFLINGIKKQNYDCYGYDISEWAQKESFRRFGIKFVENVYNKFDLMFSLDVFEHMYDHQILNCLSTFDPDILVVRIPCADFNKNSYHLDISKNDPTHINCKDKDQWFDFFIKNEYKNFVKLDLLTIYDSTGVMSYIIYK
jgi:2-polyprenyl-3-methyl-5-hydroxy-6-metoxy-1,4-benzoquinol methylase